MTNYVIHTNGTGAESGRKLARALGWTPIPMNDLGERDERVPNGSRVLLYGTEGDFVDGADVTFINTPRSIRLAKDKACALAIMRESGVSVPVTCSARQVEQFLDAGSLKLPVVGRSAQHSNGSGLWVCLSRKDVEIVKGLGASHFVQHVPMSEEYRVYLYKDTVVKVLSKQPSMESGMNLVVRSNDEGWYWSLCQNPPREVVEQAQKARRAMGDDLALCGVDVAVEEGSGRAFVFEVNTASWLSEDTARIYAATICVDLGLPSPDPRTESRDFSDYEHYDGDIY